MAVSLKLPNLVRSTAGAVPVMNEKGEFTMQKVKVMRYVSGRRPDYAPEESESESSEEEEGFVPAAEVGSPEREEEREESRVDDRRLQRLRERQASGPTRERRERVIEEPEVIYEASDESDQEQRRLPVHRIIESDSESEEEELDDEAIERRREMMRERARRKAMEEVCQ